MTYINNMMITIKIKDLIKHINTINIYTYIPLIHKSDEILQVFFT